MTATALGHWMGRSELRGGSSHWNTARQGKYESKKNTIRSRNAVIPFQPHNILRSTARSQTSRPDRIRAVAISSENEPCSNKFRHASGQLLPRFGSVRSSSVSVRGHEGGWRACKQASHTWPTREKRALVSCGDGPERQPQRQPQAMPQTGPGGLFFFVLLSSCSWSAWPPCMEVPKGSVG